MIQKVIQFFRHDLWRMPSDGLSFFRKFLLDSVKVVALAARGFTKAKCYLHASALTFYSLLSVVPVIALLFGVARGFGYESILKKQLEEKFANQKEVLAWIVEFAYKLLHNIQGGFIAGIGVCFLLWTIIKLCTNIELSFNDIWQVKEPRSWLRKFTDYLAVLFIAPLLFVISNGMTVALSGGIGNYLPQIIPSAATTVIIDVSLKLFSIVFIWMLFSFVYIFMPNTRVKLKSGLIAGFIAGIVYLIVQWAYIRFQVGVAKYGAIYGGFAALPLFLIWLQLSWSVVLVGAEIAYAIQNFHNYEFVKDCAKLSNSFVRLLALRITTICVKAFDITGNQWTAKKIADHLRMPLHFIKRILAKLVHAEILVEVVSEDKKYIFYHPAKPTDKLTIIDVTKMWDNSGEDILEINKSGELKKLIECTSDFEKRLKEAPSNILIRDV